MGKIKKILENELIGGTQSTDVYPVTSVKAVYDENNERLDNILGGLRDKIGVLKQEIIYDVSARNGGVVFESLSSLLSSPNLSTLIPTSVRHGGMSIRFIQGSEQSSDNKYVQFRYMSSSTSDTDFTNAANWQGVDDKPTANSENLVKSGGTDKKILDDILKYSSEEVINSTVTDNAYYVLWNRSKGKPVSTVSLIPESFNGSTAFVVEVKQGDRVIISTKNKNLSTSYGGSYVITDSNRRPVKIGWIERDVTQDLITNPIVEKIEQDGYVFANLESSYLDLKPLAKVVAIRKSLTADVKKLQGLFVDLNTQKVNWTDFKRYYQIGYVVSKDSKINIDTTNKTITILSGCHILCNNIWVSSNNMTFDYSSQTQSFWVGFNFANGDLVAIPIGSDGLPIMLEDNYAIIGYISDYYSNYIIFASKYSINGVSISLYDVTNIISTSQTINRDVESSPQYKSIKLVDSNGIFKSIFDSILKYSTSTIIRGEKKNDAYYILYNKNTEAVYSVINDTPNTFQDSTALLLEVKAGDTVIIKTKSRNKLDSYAGSYVITNAQRQTLKVGWETRGVAQDLISEPIVEHIEEDGFIFANLDASYVSERDNAELIALRNHNNSDIKLLNELQNSWIDKNNRKRLMNKTMSNIASILDWGVIGASFEEGQVEILDKNSSNYISGTYIGELSWSDRLAALNQISMTKFTLAGNSIKQWCTNTSAKGWGNGTVGASANPKQAYIIVVNTNDCDPNKGPETAGDIQTDVDFNDYTNNADTEIGWVCRCIQMLRSVAPHSYIFLCTIRNIKSSYPEQNEKREAFSAAVRTIPAYFNHCYLLDIRENGIANYNSTEYFNKYRVNNHLVPSSYLIEAFIFNTLINQIIEENMADFKYSCYVNSSYEGNIDWGF